MSTPQPAGDTALQEALTLHRSGEHERAMQKYVAILQTNPGHVDALYYIAVLGLQQGQLDEGIRVLDRALELAPRQARLHNLQGQAHLRRSDDEAALQCFTRAIEADPTFADAYGNRATLLCELGRPGEALADFDRGLELRPHNAEDHCNRAGALADLGRLDEALAGFSRALMLMPDLGPAYFNRADVYRRLGRQTEALHDCDRMIELHPEHPVAHSNRGLILKELGRLDEALVSINRALEIDPNFVEALAARGNVAAQQGRLEQAEADHRRALELRPDFPAVEYGLALTRLARGDWRTGFALYEARLRLPEHPLRSIDLPRWDPANTAGQGPLLLLCERSAADTIQFARFAATLAERGETVTLAVPAPLQGLLSSLPGVNVVNDEALSAANQASRWTPLMSLAGAIGATPESVPGRVPYLAADPDRVAHWRGLVGPGRLRVGIHWNAGRADERGGLGQRRSIPLEAFAPLAALDGVRLVSLQTGASSADVGVVPFGDQIMAPLADVTLTVDKFAETAALIAALDLIVTCDGPVAHIAGALGVRVINVLPAVPDWRWLTDRDDTPWYPSMRLTRATAPQQWDDAFTKVTAMVAEMESSQLR